MVLQEPSLFVFFSLSFFKKTCISVLSQGRKCGSTVLYTRSRIYRGGKLCQILEIPSAEPQFTQTLCSSHDCLSRIARRSVEFPTASFASRLCSPRERERSGQSISPEVWYFFTRRFKHLCFHLTPPPCPGAPLSFLRFL